MRGDRLALSSAINHDAQFSGGDRSETSKVLVRANWAMNVRQSLGQLQPNSPNVQ
jgi:hypothetical protein